jgi:hypothetical protein
MPGRPDRPEAVDRTMQPHWELLRKRGWGYTGTVRTGAGEKESEDHE